MLSGIRLKLDNKSVIRCFGVKYRHPFLLVACILSAAQLVKIYGDTVCTSHRNIFDKATMVSL